MMERLTSKVGWFAAGTVAALVFGAGCSGKISTGDVTPGSGGNSAGNGGAGAVAGTGAGSGTSGMGGNGMVSGNGGAGTATGGAGAVTGNGGVGTGSGGTGTGGAAVVACDPKAMLTPARVWQLSDEQYVNVVRDVFKVTLTGDASAVTTAKSVSGDFTNLSEGTGVGLPTVQAYQRSASKLSAQVIANMPTLVAGCTVTPDATCIGKFITTIVPRAWRRPITTAETSGLMALYTMGLPDGAARGAGMVIEAVVQAGSFIYRTEVGTTAPTAVGPIALTPHELASALSFMFMDSVPDATLLAKADDGSLVKVDVLSTEVDRLIALPAAQAPLIKKISYWAGMERIPLVQKDPLTFPEWTATLRDGLYQSSQKFLQDIFTTGTLTDLLSSNKVYVNQEIAKVYGLSGAPATGMTAITVANRSAGVFTQPGILASTNHRQAVGDPIHRGLYIYDAYVCANPIPDPPAGALAIAATQMGTERQLVDMRAKLFCGACHSRFDPMGLTTEQFDPIGRYTATDSMGVAIDASADVAGLGPDLDGHLTGIADLAGKLRAGRRVADCSAGALSRFSLGFAPEALNSCAIRDVKDAFAKVGTFKGFFRALATSPGFISRSPGL
jgi:Protein of unknown function (DUF1592)/Protein of unknown function (DUF1588)/Protein of unknown function (DUF1595)/Protein of unknown function (DUF1587)